MLDEKCCAKCKITKSLTEYYNSKRDGIYAQCKTCCRARHELRKPNPNLEALAKREEQHAKSRPGFKICIDCKVDKPRSDYYPRLKAKPNGAIEGRCKVCVLLRTAEYHKENVEKIKARHRVTKLKNLYGLTPEEYQKLCDVQENRCKICGETPPKTSSRKMKLAIDHSHKKGHIRGLLCHRCNLVLGNFNDDPHLFRQALVYLSEDAMKNPE